MSLSYLVLPRPNEIFAMDGPSMAEWCYADYCCSDTDHSQYWPRCSNLVVEAAVDIAATATHVSVERHAPARGPKRLCHLQATAVTIGHVDPIAIVVCDYPIEC